MAVSSVSHRRVLPERRAVCWTDHFDPVLDGVMSSDFGNDVLDELFEIISGERTPEDHHLVAREAVDVPKGKVRALLEPEADRFLDPWGDRLPVWFSAVAQGHGFVPEGLEVIGPGRKQRVKEGCQPLGNASASRNAGGSGRSCDRHSSRPLQSHDGPARQVRANSHRLLPSLSPIALSLL
jgi:hypothetical protein